MDELRWILLVVGGAAVAGVYGFTRWQEGRRKQRRGGDAFHDDKDIEDALRDLDEVVADRDPLEPRSDDFDVIPISREESPDPDYHAARAKQAPPPAAKPAADADDATEPAPAAGLEDKVIVLNVAATDGRLFSGQVLVEALELAGLQYGEHAIYHRILDTRKGPVSLFSAANILRPGTFEPERREEIESPGIAMFLQLPGPYDGLAAFEQMLETARRIADELGVKLLDERRCSLTNQAIEHIREELREYRRLAHLQARKS